MLHGELDIVVAPEAGHALATALGVELEVLKGVGHLVVDQDPNAIAEAVRSLSSRSLL